jgi:hypothetical protein
VQNSPYTDPDSASLGPRFYKLNTASTNCETVVGFYRVPLPKGYSLIANQLDNGKGNKVVDVIPSPPNGTFLFKFNGTGYTIIDYADGEWEGDDVNMTLSPGEGAFIRVATAWTNTFIGEVLTGNLSTPIAAGYSIVSSKIPKPGLLVSDLHYLPSSLSDFVFQSNPATGGYSVSDFLCILDPSIICEDLQEPLLLVGEAFFVRSAMTNTWVQDFCPQ